MKTSGQEITVYEDVLVLPRQGGALTFKGRAVQDMGAFNDLCPLPKPPVVDTPKGRKVMSQDTGYKQQLANYSSQKLAWLLITTLYEVEWETVDADEPKTWQNWIKECSESGLSEQEQQRLVQFVLTMNCMNEKAMEQARSDFMATQVVQALEQLSSPTNDQPSS